MSHASISTNLSTIDIDIGLAKDITIGIERTRATQVVDTLSTTKDITFHPTAVHINMRFSCFVYTLQGSQRIRVVLTIDISTTNSSNLAATEDTVTDIATLNVYIGYIYATIINISATKDVTTGFQIIVGNKVAISIFPCFVNNFFLIALIDNSFSVIIT